jgi:PilZ domain-containing protein
MSERRKLDRREFSEYMRVLNERTGELIGHLADIGTEGFKIESKNPIDANLEFLLRMDLMVDVGEKDHIVFTARSRWCKKDNFDPTLFDIGFQIIEMAPEDLQIFVHMFEKYGSGSSNNRKDKGKTDYLWR